MAATSEGGESFAELNFEEGETEWCDYAESTEESVTVKIDEYRFTTVSDKALAKDKKGKKKKKG